MIRLGKLATRLALGLGLLVTIVHTLELLDPRTSPEDRQEAIPNLIGVGVPLTGLGGWQLWRERRRAEQQAQDCLRATFFQILQSTQGQITPLQFAMATGLDGKTAKAYLDARACEFDAQYHVTPEGTVSYYFELALEAAPCPPAEPTVDSP
ncbi:MAG: hypothetical protein IGS50_16275 [Synechococcales cyanobacterium C42_A2020_086]|jgi:hypothetical protein|nr:hypothetical protein [Synechococcales cyanobacterium C42_A2020_086]